MSESGPFNPADMWDQIEQGIWYHINTATHHALTTYAEEYANAREEWTARQPCSWTYSWEDDGLHWWDCETHGDSDHTEAPDAEPAAPCDSAEPEEQEADK